MNNATKHNLESINADLFNVIDPEQESWVGGAAASKSVSGSVTYSGGHADGGGDFDWTF